MQNAKVSNAGAPNSANRLKLAGDANPKLHKLAPQSASKPFPLARKARPRRRHKAALFSLAMLVIGPVATSGWYLFDRAAPQYASYVGFSVRNEEAPTAMEMLGGMSDFGGGATKDADILYEFLTSQQIVDQARTQLDLPQIWQAESDPVFSLGTDYSLEALTSHWGRQVAVTFDPSSGLIEVRTLAFAPEDAQMLADLIAQESSDLINALTTESRQDAIAFAQADLDRAEARLAGARTALARFRSTHQLVDPEADLAGQMGVLSTLQAQLAEALIELDLMRDDPRAGQFRAETAEKRVETIRSQILQERERIATGTTGQAGYSALVTEFEGLSMEVEFAQNAYLSALSAFEGARADALRQTRYLATYIEPTVAERADFPRRYVILAVIAAGALGLWSILILTYYGIRDRR